MLITLVNYSVLNRLNIGVSSNRSSVRSSDKELQSNLIISISITGMYWNNSDFRGSLIDRSSVRFKDKRVYIT